MCNLPNSPTPFFYGLLASLDRQVDAFFTEEFVELGDAGSSGLINDRMIDVADSGTSVDASVAVDRKDLL